MVDVMERVLEFPLQACASKARDLLPPVQHLSGPQLCSAAQGTAGSAAEGKAAAAADRPMTAREVKQLLVPLVRLRQACCHPQVRLSRVRGIFWCA